MIPQVLDLRLTSKCNMRCSFCFGTQCAENWDNQALRRFFAFMQDNGLKFIVLTGGEPTASPNFIPIVETLKSLGIHIALSTNGTFWSNENLRNFVLASCDWIALPVESPLTGEHNYLRRCSFNHHELVYSILPQIKEIAPNIKVKVGTVATKCNYKSIPFILDSLPIQPTIWKIFQLSPSEVNMDFYKMNRITDEEFRELINTVQHH